MSSTENLTPPRPAGTPATAQPNDPAAIADRHAPGTVLRIRIDWSDPASGKSGSRKFHTVTLPCPVTGTGALLPCDPAAAPGRLPFDVDADPTANGSGPKRLWAIAAGTLQAADVRESVDITPVRTLTESETAWLTAARAAALTPPHQGQVRFASPDYLIVLAVTTDRKTLSVLPADAGAGAVTDWSVQVQPLDGAVPIDPIDRIPGTATAVRPKGSVATISVGRSVPVGSVPDSELPKLMTAALLGTPEARAQYAPARTAPQPNADDPANDKPKPVRGPWQVGDVLQLHRRAAWIIDTLPDSTSEFLAVCVTADFPHRASAQPLPDPVPSGATQPFVTVKRRDRVTARLGTVAVSPATLTLAGAARAKDAAHWSFPRPVVVWRPKTRQQHRAVATGPRHVTGQKYPGIDYRRMLGRGDLSLLHGGQIVADEVMAAQPLSVSAFVWLADLAPGQPTDPELADAAEQLAVRPGNIPGTWAPAAGDVVVCRLERKDTHAVVLDVHPGADGTWGTLTVLPVDSNLRTVKTSPRDKVPLTLTGPDVDKAPLSLVRGQRPVDVPVTSVSARLSRWLAPDELADARDIGRTGYLDRELLPGRVVWIRGSRDGADRPRPAVVLRRVGERSLTVAHCTSSPHRDTWGGHEMLDPAAAGLTRSGKVSDRATRVSLDDVFQLSGVLADDDLAAVLRLHH